MEPQMKRVTRYIVVALVTLLTFGTMTGATMGNTTSATEKVVASQFIPESQVALMMATVPPVVNVLQHEVYAAHASEEVEVVNVEVEASAEASTETPLDRTKPIYEVYKNGYKVEVPVETQWIIRDLSAQYGFDEKIVFGLALAESTFNPNATGDSERSLGLYQIQRYWIRGANITHFTDDYASRNLFDPYDATLTLMEIWTYAVQANGIDISTEQGMKDLLYWHNTGQYIKNVNWKYSNKIFGFANELVALQ